MSGSRMDDEPGRLADHDQIVVGEADVDRDGLGTGRPVGRRLGEELHERAGLETVALDDRLSPDEHGAVVDEAGDLGPAPAGQEREGPIEPLARQRRRHGELAHAARLTRSRGARHGRAIPTPGAARRRS